jgi:hypothetical protein
LIILGHMPVTPSNTFFILHGRTFSSFFEKPMSESQKVWTSLTGTVVAHLLLLVLVFAMLSFRRVTVPSGAASSDVTKPREVLVAIGDLLEQARLEEPEVPEQPAAPEPPPEPEPFKEQVPTRRAFMSTDLNAPEAAAPVGARFESDRNTSAATEIAPDRNAPQQSGAPTTAGDRPTPHLALANREFVDGPLDQVGSAGGGGSPAAPAPPAPPTPPAQAQTPPSVSTDSGGQTGLLMEAELARTRSGKPGDPNDATTPSERSGADAETLMTEADRPPEHVVGEELARPAGTRPEGTAPEELRMKSFEVPTDGSASALAPAKIGTQDAFAKKQESEVKVGSATDLAASTQAASATGANGKDQEEIVSDGPPPSPDVPSQMTPMTKATATPSAVPPALASADDGLFAEGMSPEERLNMINGDITRIGQNAVDAEATEMGRYKKAVNDVIKQRWHRYRQDRGADVSWGVLKLRFRVNENGKVSDLTVIENKADTALVELSMRAIVDSKLPPMPEAVATEVGGTGLEMQYDIIIY